MFLSPEPKMRSRGLWPETSMRSLSTARNSSEVMRGRPGPEEERERSWPRDMVEGTGGATSQKPCMAPPCMIQQ